MLETAMATEAPKGLLASLVAPIVKKFEKSSQPPVPPAVATGAPRRQRSRSSVQSQQGGEVAQAGASTVRQPAAQASGGGLESLTGNVNPLTGSPLQANAAVPMAVDAPNKRKDRESELDEDECDELGAHMLGQRSEATAAAPSQPRAARTELWRQDHKLTTSNDRKGGKQKKAMTMEGMANMQIIMAKHLLTVGLQCKVAKCVGIFSIDTEVDSCFQVECKKRTTALHNMLAPLTKSERRRAGMAPHAVVMEGMLDEGIRVCNERHVESKSDACKVAFTDYMATLPEEPKERLATLLDDWRYARWRSTYKQARAIFEIGISPIASRQAHDLLKAIIKLLAQTVDGELRHGIAPKTQLELRLEQALKGLGAWNNYEN
jgi:hypothetical protein